MFKTCLNRRDFLSASVGAVFTPLVWANPEGFERFRQQQTQAFSDYKTALEQGFSDYKKVAQEEFNQFKQGVKRQWGDEKVGSRFEWVEYSPDQKTRTRVDFEKAELHIEVLAQNADQVKDKVRERLTDVATKTVAQAQRDDQLAQAIEKRMTQDARLVESARSESTKPDSADLQAKPVLADVLTGKPTPTRDEIQASIMAAAKRGKSSSRAAPNKNEQVFVFSIPLQPANISAKAHTYQPLVKRYAAEYKLDPALVLAIMHSESSFNPLAKSAIPAFGLMQIVPQSAGRDASELVYGRQRLLAPSYLYREENNIKMGCAYLHILHYRYLRAITDVESRTYCVIAAYNTGAGNVARSFNGGSRNVAEAANRINAMSPAQVYSHLVAHLPFEETRNYMKKVTPRYRSYQALV